MSVSPGPSSGPERLGGTLSAATLGGAVTGFPRSRMDGWFWLQADGWGGDGHVDGILLTNYLAPGYVYRMLFLEDGLLPSDIPW